MKRKIKKKMLVYVLGYVYTQYLVSSPFVLAIEGGVNCNPSSRERLFLRTAYIPFCCSTRRRCELYNPSSRERYATLPALGTLPRSMSLLAPGPSQSIKFQIGE